MELPKASRVNLGKHSLIKRFLGDDARLQLSLPSAAKLLPGSLYLFKCRFFSTVRHFAISQIVIAFLLPAIIYGGVPPEASCQNASQAPNGSTRLELPSLTAELSMLEKRLKLTAPVNQPVSERIGSLEMVIFGAPQPGSFLARLQKIEQTLDLSTDQISTSATTNGAAKQPYNSTNPPLTQTPQPHPIPGSDKLLPLPPQLDVQDSLTGQGQFPLKYSPNINTVDPLAARLMKLTPLRGESSVNFVRIENVGANPNQAGDYFDLIMKATKGKVVRFKQMPIPVYITPFPDPAFTNACVGAFEDWEERGRGLVSFRQVENPDHARIRVIWSHLGLANNPHDCSLGAHTLTSWRRQNSGTRIIFVGGIPIPLKLSDGTYTVPPQVIEVNLDLISAKPEEVRMRVLKNVVAHELGHALGILGHSPARCDLMYAVTDECSRLSQHDINTLSRLYQAKVDIPL